MASNSKNGRGRFKNLRVMYSGSSQSGWGLIDVSKEGALIGPRRDLRPNVALSLSSKAFSRDFVSGDGSFSPTSILRLGPLTSLMMSAEFTSRKDFQSISKMCGPLTATMFDLKSASLALQPVLNPADPEDNAFASSLTALPEARIDCCSNEAVTLDLFTVTGHGNNTRAGLSNDDGMRRGGTKVLAEKDNTLTLRKKRPRERPHEAGVSPSSRVSKVYISETLKRTDSTVYVLRAADLTHFITTFGLLDNFMRSMNISLVADGGRSKKARQRRGRQKPILAENKNFRNCPFKSCRFTQLELFKARSFNKHIVGEHFVEGSICCWCGRNFSRRDAMLRHQRKRHNTTTVRDALAKRARKFDQQIERGFLIPEEGFGAKLASINICQTQGPDEEDERQSDLDIDSDCSSLSESNGPTIKVQAEEATVATARKLASLPDLKGFFDSEVSANSDLNVALITTSSPYFLRSSMMGSREAVEGCESLICDQF